MPRTAPARTRSSAARPACRSSSPPTPTTGTAHRRSRACNYEFVSEGGTRLAGLKSGEYDLITNLPPQDVDQAPKRGQAGPGEPDHSSSTPTRASPPTRTCAWRSTSPIDKDGDRRCGLRRLRRGRRRSAAEPVDPRLQRHARAVRLRPRRGQAADRGGRRRRRDDHARRRVVGPLAQRPRARRGGRRLLDRRPGSRSTCRRRSSAPTSTSCSTVRTARTRSSCRARTTSSTPTAS